MVNGKEVERLVGIQSDAKLRRIMNDASRNLNPTIDRTKLNSTSKTPALSEPEISQKRAAEAVTDDLSSRDRGDRSTAQAKMAKTNTVIIIAEPKWSRAFKWRVGSNSPFP